MSDAVVDKSLFKDRTPQIIPLKMDATALSWAVPSSLTEFAAATATRTRADLSRFKEARLGCNCTVVAATGADIRVQYSLDGTNWAYLDNNAGPSVDGDAVAVALSSWVQIAPLDNSAWKNVLLRVVGIGGNGSTAGSYANIWLEVR